MELIMVIAIIGILAGVSVAVINPNRQTEMAKEATKKSNMLKTCSAIKAFEAEFGRFPEEGTNNNPLDSTDPLATDADKLSFYLEAWPEGFIYNVQSLGATNNKFGVHVKQDVGDYYWKCNDIYNDVFECKAANIDIPGACSFMRH